MTTMKNRIDMNAQLDFVIDSMKLVLEGTLSFDSVVVLFEVNRRCKIYALEVQDRRVCEQQHRRHHQW
jgi:hypothetical protein